jgi:hypothetical protein
MESVVIGWAGAAVLAGIEKTTDTKSISTLMQLLRVFASLDPVVNVRLQFLLHESTACGSELPVRLGIIW